MQFKVQSTDFVVQELARLQGLYFLKDQHHLEERLKKLENLSGLVVPQDDMDEERQEIEKKFAQGGGI